MEDFVSMGFKQEIGQCMPLSAVKKFCKDNSSLSALISVSMKKKMLAE